MIEDEWIKKLNDLCKEIDEIAGSVHPSVATALTADLREEYLALAQSNKVTPNAQA